MKTLTYYLTLFFALAFFAKAENSPYGLIDLVPVTGAQVSFDGDWIRYNGDLYRNINLPRYRGESILFVKGPNIAGAQASEDKEFLFYGRNNYQKFRTDWKPSRSKPSLPTKQEGRSPIALMVSVLGMLWFFWHLERHTRKSPDSIRLD